MFVYEVLVVVVAVVVVVLGIIVLLPRFVVQTCLLILVINVQGSLLFHGLFVLQPGQWKHRMLSPSVTVLLLGLVEMRSPGHLEVLCLYLLIQTIPLVFATMNTW